MFTRKKRSFIINSWLIYFLFSHVFCYKTFLIFFKRRKRRRRRRKNQITCPLYECGPYLSVPDERRFFVFFFFLNKNYVSYLNSLCVIIIIIITIPRSVILSISLFLSLFDLLKKIVHYNQLKRWWWWWWRRSACVLIN